MLFITEKEILDLTAGMKKEEVVGVVLGLHSMICDDSIQTPEDYKIKSKILSETYPQNVQMIVIMMLMSMIFRGK